MQLKNIQLPLSIALNFALGATLLLGFAFRSKDADPQSPDRHTQIQYKSNNRINSRSSTPIKVTIEDGSNDSEGLVSVPWTAIKDIDLAFDNLWTEAGLGDDLISLLDLNKNEIRKLNKLTFETIKNLQTELLASKQDYCLYENGTWKIHDRKAIRIKFRLQLIAGVSHILSEAKSEIFKKFLGENPHFYTRTYSYKIKRNNNEGEGVITFTIQKLFNGVIESEEIWEENSLEFARFKFLTK